MATPYITSAMLLSRPAGISWNIIPTLTASTAEQTAQLAQACWTATSVVDTYCRQPLRAIVNTEEVQGPGQPRISVNRDTGIATLITRRWPVRSVEAVQTSPARSFPPVWTLAGADQAVPRHPVIISAGPAPETGPGGGNAIDVAPQVITWEQGRSGTRVLFTYTSGMGPHTSLTTGAVAGATELLVDDVTGWAGATGYAYDGEFTEPVQVTTAVATAPVQLPGVAGTVQAGAGTLTLPGPLASSHDVGTVISAMPAQVLRAAALAATVEALETIDAIAVQSMSGQSVSIGALAESMELLLDDFRRIA